MSRYETDQEQIDVLKKWWNENGTSLLIGLLVVVVGWSGWIYYSNIKTNNALQASAVFEMLQAKQKQGQFGDVAREGMKLMEEQPESPYASAVALMLAKYQFEKGNTEKAVEHLDWVIMNTKDASLKLTAQLRLASVYLDKGQNDKVKQTLEAVQKESLKASEKANYEFQMAMLALAEDRLEDARKFLNAVIDNTEASANLQNLARLQLEDIAKN